MTMIFPVWLSSMETPNLEELVYALIDTQSDTIFIHEDVARRLHAKAARKTLNLTTLSSQSEAIDCNAYDGLRVRGFQSNKLVDLPTVHAMQEIPLDKSHIPTREVAESYPHLERIADQIPPPQDCDVGLLIGYDCPEAFRLIQQVTGLITSHSLNSRL
ncbi:hypothetical protein HOLleu_38745 [Holothuria leucospilota]|uniref:Uncharacterized protein n=1 Tax=Holothuria leucospilota TaxID=206669 RepID=A0A9Q0YMC7_HOLLE|nr:hypothetical protein HOLleu_38745 [Holothuria leucospilota]